MYLTQVNRLRNLDKETYEVLRRLCRISKNLYNVGVYNIRQKYLFEHKFTDYYQNYHDCKHNENYQYLVQIGQCVLRQVDYAFRSFFKLLKLKKQGKNLGRVNLPGYLEKDEMYPVTFHNQLFRIVKGKIRLSMPKKFRKDFDVKLRYLWFDFPKHIDPESVKEIKIVPHYKGMYFTIHITYKKEVQEYDLDYNEFLGIDLGVNNFAACIDTLGSSFILDGKYLKSVNQEYNKLIAKFKSILDKQYPKEKKYSKRLYRITTKRNNQIRDIMNKYVNLLVNYCLNNRIGNIVVGNLQAQNGSKLGRINNQNFVQIPFGQFVRKLKLKCELYNINCETIDESYTSICSFLDKELPQKHDQYKGKRVLRGLFKTSCGKLVNADINSAANIIVKFLTKSSQNIEQMFNRLGSGLVNRPVRIRFQSLVGTNFSLSLGACLQGS